MSRAMKSHLGNSRLILLAVLWLITIVPALAQVPARPEPPRLVNDLAQVFTQEEATALEQKLVDFSNKTSNQIVVVTIPDLNGYEPSQMAYQIGETWKVGQAKFDNGVVILVKPKQGNSRGEAFIATGYGLEGALPDAICKRIVTNEMIPSFRNNNYFEGISKATDVVMKIASGEYNSSEYAAKGAEGGAFAAIAVVIIIVIIFIVLVSRKNGPTNLGGGNRRGPSAIDLLILGSLMSGGGRSSGGGFGGFGGGGGGGFGGFGGGGFGGGGAGGSW